MDVWYKGPWWLRSTGTFATLGALWAHTTMELMLGQTTEQSLGQGETENSEKSNTPLKIHL